MMDAAEEQLVNGILTELENQTSVSDEMLKRYMQFLMRTGHSLQFLKVISENPVHWMKQWLSQRGES